jgi:hypothetical protein
MWEKMLQGKYWSALYKVRILDSVSTCFIAPISTAPSGTCDEDLPSSIQDITFFNLMKKSCLVVEQPVQLVDETIDSCKRQCGIKEPSKLNPSSLLFHDRGGGKVG